MNNILNRLSELENYKYSTISGLNDGEKYFLPSLFTQKTVIVVNNEETIKDYSLQLAQAIEHSFSSPFSVDLDSIVKQTKPKFETIIQADKYQIICGTGYRASMEYENAHYKDIKTGKKVSRLGITFNFPLEEREETAEILDVIDRKIKGLSLNELSRFEIAQQVLYTQLEEELDFSEEDEEGEEE